MCLKEHYSLARSAKDRVAGGTLLDAQSHSELFSRSSCGFLSNYKEVASLLSLALADGAEDEGGAGVACC